MLGAIVFLIAVRLIDLRKLWSIRQESPQEFALAIATAACVVVVGVEQGIVLAMVISLLRIVHHSYHPDTGVLIFNDAKTWDIIPPVPGTVTQPGLVIYRFGAALFYANAARFAKESSGPGHAGCAVDGDRRRGDYARRLQRFAGDR